MKKKRFDNLIGQAVIIDGKFHGIVTNVSIDVPKNIFKRIFQKIFKPKYVSVTLDLDSSDREINLTKQNT